MVGLGDIIAFISAVASLIYGLCAWRGKKVPFYYQLIVVAIACHALSFLYDVCELFTIGTLSDGFNIGYFGTIASFLFLITASYGYMDGIMDDKTQAMTVSRTLALLAPLMIALLFIPNIFADVQIATKVWYFIVWVPALFSTYFNLKHALIPDMGFGFIRAIRPFNLAALLFTTSVLLHLTLWNFCGWIPLLVTGSMVGASCFIMMISAKKGVEGWTL